MRLRHKPDAWDRFRERVRLVGVGAQAMANARFSIGSNLPYAAWIEEGKRLDPRFGTVYVNYRDPSAAEYMRTALRQVNQGFRSIVHRQRSLFGETFSTYGAGVFDVRTMYALAGALVDAMKFELHRQVYSRPQNPRLGFNRNSGRRWERRLALYKSIQARRV